MSERRLFDRIWSSRLWASVCVPMLFALGCGASSASRGDSSAPEPLERWRTDAEWVLSSRERCMTGPFEVEVPDRDIAYGRRFVVEVFGDRGLPLDSRFAYTNGWSSSGWGWSEEELGERLGDHSACRMPEEERTPGEAGAPGRGGPSPSGDPAPPARGAPPSSGEGETTAELPELDRHEGPLPNTARQQRSIAWYPKGNPNLYAIDGLSEEYMEEGGQVGFRFRFWFHRPVDATGLVIRIRDQVLVPTIDEARYVAGFSARVAEVDRRLLEAERVAGYQPNEPARGRVPPPPRREVIPDPPAPGVEWLPGHFRYHEGIADFVWIAGTYVVRARPDVAEEAPPASAVEIEAEVSDEEVVALEASVPPRPEPRVETVPPPPSVPGAQWVAGYWELRGEAWAWVAGRWQAPRRSGARFRAPSIEKRGEVKVYLPGGWTLGAGLRR